MEMSFLNFTIDRNWELGREGLDMITGFLATPDFPSPVSRGMKATVQIILRKLSKCVGWRVLPG